jgi:rhomboid protease GluP
MSAHLDTLPGASVARFRIPVVTLALLAVLIGVYILELLTIDPAAPGGGGMNGSLLIAAGGVNSPIILGHGQWYRLVTATLLHGNFFHILMNGIVLLFGGALLESRIGPAWFLALYVLSGLGGSCASLALDGPNINSVGASGAIMGVLAGAFVLTFHATAGTGRGKARIALLRLLVPALIPHTARGGLQIDVAAHLGGAIAGALVALGIMAIWDEGASRPRFVRFANAVPLAALLLMPIGLRSGMATYALLQGAAAEATGRLSFADVALSRAIEFDPSIEDSLGERGAVRFALKRYPEAAADFRALADRRPDWGYATLLLHLARTRAEEDDRAEFAKNALSVDLGAWPGPAVALFLGRTTPEAVRTAAAAAEAATREHQTCEASFYIGEWDLLRRAPEQGLPLIEAAAKGCPRDFFEHKLAVAELDR